jgi:hypothetical protein
MCLCFRTSRFYIKKSNGMNQIEQSYTSPTSTTAYPTTSGKKRTHSTLSERRYCDSNSSSSMLDEIDIYTSADKDDKFSVANLADAVGTAEKKGANKLLNYVTDSTSMHVKAPSQSVKPTIPPVHYHSRHRSCHQRKPSLLINSNPKSTEETLEAVRKSYISNLKKSGTKSSKAVSFCGEIDHFSDSVILKTSEAGHCQTRSEASHTRTASDFDSVIMMGKDDSGVASS